VKRLYSCVMAAGVEMLNDKKCKGDGMDAYHGSCPSQRCLWLAHLSHARSTRMRLCCAESLCSIIRIRGLASNASRRLEAADWFFSPSSKAAPRRMQPCIRKERAELGARGDQTSSTPRWAPTPRWSAGIAPSWWTLPSLPSCKRSLV
jgi:hypothetical protein